MFSTKHSVKYQIFFKMSVYLGYYVSCDWYLLAIRYMGKGQALALVSQTLNCSLKFIQKYLQILE